MSAFAGFDTVAMSHIDTPEQWRQVRALFERCADLPPERWQSELDAACPEHAALRAEALAMLKADAATDTDWAPRYHQPPHLLHALVAAMDEHSRIPTSQPGSHRRHENTCRRRACAAAAIVLAVALAAGTATALWLARVSS